MKKWNMKKVLVVISIIIIIIGIIGTLLVNRPKEIFKMSSYYAMGSIRLKICDNGGVYEDREIEEPNHRIKYKKVYTLENEQLSELKRRIEENESNEEIEEFIKETIYERNSLPTLGGLPMLKEQN